MAAISVSLDLSVLLREGGMVDEALGRKAQAVERHAKILCPVDTGYLRNSIGSERADRPLVWVVFANAAYASWIHDGERWDPRSGKIIYVKVGPRPFLLDALRAAA